VPVFVIQKHAATSLHYDFRLEVDGTMRSWAIPKGPSTDPKQRRLAMAVDDHPMSWNEFEGVIGRGYGAGTVIRWDEGEYRNTTPDRSMAEGLDDGYARFVLEGHKLRGEWSLRRMSDLLRGPRQDRAGSRLGRPEPRPQQQRQGWLLVKRRDEHADAKRDPVRDEPESVLSGLTIEEVAERD
jgi:DNA ligase D-like protein (predicted 3'-phosphoesterase)